MKYKMDNANIREKVSNLLSQMTISEKVAQLGYIDMNKPGSLDIIKSGRAGVAVNVNGVEQANYLQQFAIKGSRFKIPLIIADDVIQGYRTIFPIPLAEACSWDLDLISRTSAAAASEAMVSGVNLTFAPMLDIARDPRWGRITEGSGEDTYLTSRVAVARVNGYHAAVNELGGRFCACMKHFAAYGACEGGRDYNNTVISENVLREVYLPPFIACVEAGVEAVMPAFTDVLGVPCSASKFLLKKILREEMGFEGVVISDYNAVYELIIHGVAASVEEACKLAIEAGVDADVNDDIYLNFLEKMVNEGEVSMDVLDAAVFRMLYLKYRIGLFDNSSYNKEAESKTLMCDQYISLSREAAQKSAVLLKNDGNLLPLNKNKTKVAVIGPFANDGDAYIGWWRCKGDPSDVVTVLAGIQNKLHDTKIPYSKGCDVEGFDEDFTEALKVACDADVVLAVVGESSQLSAEAHCRSNLGLPGPQQRLIEALHATGKPIIVVLIAGRPLSMPWIAKHIPAIIEAWEPGLQGGNAIADIIYGDYCPSGKLCTSIPYSASQLPVYYNHKNCGRPLKNGAALEELGVTYDAYYMYGTDDTSKYSDALEGPLYPFGYGLSYTKFEYSGLRINNKKLKGDESLFVQVTVKNTGEVMGDEIVQLYVQDTVGSVSRPVKELKGFQRVTLSPGCKNTIDFELNSEDFGFYNTENRFVVEPGLFRLWVGPNSQKGIMETFEITAN